ncbi:MAG: 2-phosphosulfolactate phosphatase [Methanobacteriaceae archaeon]|nr:2-phosphosulfolactate phosphatase [Methanobacteriaceae archaeon]
MLINLSLYQPKNTDVAIVIDLLRASTTIIKSLETFNKVKPVNIEDEKIIQLSKKHNAILAGERKRSKIKGFDLSNSPKDIQNYEGELLILKTTNGTKVLENIQKKYENAIILIGSSINAEEIAKKIIQLNKEKVELVMAGRRQTFAIEDYVGAGIIINEIIKASKTTKIDLELTEYAKTAQIVTKDLKLSQELIEDSTSAKKLRLLNAGEDVEICKQINKSTIVPIYKNKIITQY